MTSSKNFKKQVRERAKQTGESFQEAKRQLIAAAKRDESEAHAVEIEQLRSDGVVMRQRIPRQIAQGFATSSMTTVLVSKEPCPSDEMPRLRLILDGLIGQPSNDPALTNGEWRPITPQEVWEFFGPRSNPNDELSLFSGGRFVRTYRWRELELPSQRWTPRKPRKA